MNTILVRCSRAARAFSVLLVFLFGTGSTLAETTDPGGGIGGTGITGFGVVQKFGSIFVNGREYFLNDNTRITRDSTSISEPMLRLGDTVTVEGRIDPATGRSVAMRVDSESALRGAVENVDVPSGTLTVLGQTVHVTSSTLSDVSKNASLLAQIHRGEAVVISGFARADGSWVATRLAPAAAGESRFVLRGEVQNIDREHGRLRIAGQTLIAPPRGLPAQLKAGDIVRVTGHYAKTGLQVESVVAARPLPGPAGRIVEMSGYIQARPSTGRLISNDVVLTYSEASTIAGGTSADLRTDVPIAVRGELQADGTVAVRAMEIGVEPMRVMLPELEVRAPRAGDEGRAGHDATEKPSREKPDTEQRGAEKREIERPDKPEMEKPEIEKPEIERPEIERPMIERPEIEMPSTD